MSGGRVVAAQLEHVWVEAFVDYVPSRGAMHREGDTWIPMDPGDKQFTYSDPIDLPATVGFDIAAVAAEVGARTTTDPAVSSIPDVPQAFVLEQTRDYVPRVQQFLDANPGRTNAEIFGDKVVVPGQSAILSGVLPYQVIARGGTFSDVPEALRHAITFEVATSAFAGPDFSYRAPTASLGGKRITLSRRRRRPTRR